MKFNNPVIAGFYPDPSICKVNDDFYLVTSTFEYFPGIPIFHSKDLVNWSQIGHCLTREAQLPLANSHSSAGIFAPTIRYHDGVFYVITTNITVGKNFFVTAEDPRGPWSDPIWLDDWPGIDPSLLFDDNGDVYITGNGDGGAAEKPGIYQAKIDPETGKLLSERKYIYEGTGGTASPEAPHLYKINDRYYLMTAEGGTEYGHMETIARSDDPFGPFEGNPNDPILTHRSLDSPIHATGHADLVELDDGSWWGVFLAIRPIGYPRKHHIGRETFLAPVEWQDGWPIFGQNGRVGLEMEAPQLFKGYEKKPESNYLFTSDTLHQEFNFLRNPYPNDWSLTDRKGWLTLNGSGVTLNDLDSPAFIGRRQTDHRCTVETYLDFAPKKDDEEAGLVTYMNGRFHYEIAKVREADQQYIILRKTLADLTVIEKKVLCDADQVILGVRADPYQYKFYVKELDNEKVVKEYQIGEAECGMLATEVAGGFTGVYIGMYATGNRKKSTTPAYFKWYNYQA